MVNVLDDTHVNDFNNGVTARRPPSVGLNEKSHESNSSATLIVAAAERLIGQSFMTIAERRFTVLHTATTLLEAEQALERHRPTLSLLVVDPPFPDASLAETCTRLIGRHPMTCALLIFRERRPKDLVLACQQGARALFDMTISAEQLIHGLERLADGEVVMQPEILRDMMQAQTSATADADSLPHLTAVQTRALTLLAEGHTSKEIARLMNITTASVNHNLERASQRLGTRHRAEAVARAFRLGLIS